MTSVSIREPKDRLIVAFDVDSPEAALHLLKPQTLMDHVGLLKIAITFMNVMNAAVMNYDLVKLQKANSFFEIVEGRLFYDCKLHDIPDQVEGAAAIIAGMNIRMFNVHCLGGAKMMRYARRGADQGAKQAGKQPPAILGVTVLTSLDYPALVQMGLMPHAVTAQIERLMTQQMEQLVVTLAKLAKESGLDGVVASAKEVPVIRQACGNDFLIVTPGIRPAGASHDDQKRVTTPRAAIQAGSDMLVVGRPINDAEDRVATAKAVVAEIAAASKEVM